MKIIDEKGKLFGLINLFDLFIIVVVIVAALFIRGKFFSNNTAEQAITYQDVEIKYLIEDVRDATVDAIKVGAATKEYDTSLPFGEVTDMEVLEHYEYVETADGNVVKTLVPDKHDVVITLKSSAIVTDTAMVIATKDVAVGRSIVITSKYFALHGVVVGIEEL